MSRPPSAAILAQVVKAAREDPAGMGAEWVPVLESVPLLANLSKRHLRRVANLAQPVRFEANTAVVRKGTRGDTFFVIIDGEARVATSRGVERLGPLDFFGEMALIDGEPRSATVEAVTEMLTMRIGREPFLKLLSSEPDIALGVMKELVRRVRRLEATRETQG
jgi:CRP-like cAMP-binding protein